MMRARRTTKLTRGSFNSKALLTTLAENGDEEEEDDLGLTGNSKKHLNLRDIKGRSSISESKNTSMLDGYSLRDEDRRETSARDSFDFGIGNLGLGSRTNSLIWDDASDSGSDWGGMGSRSDSTSDFGNEGELTHNSSRNSLNFNFSMSKFNMNE